MTILWCRLLLQVNHSLGTAMNEQERNFFHDVINKLSIAKAKLFRVNKLNKDDKIALELYKIQKALETALFLVEEKRNKASNELDKKAS